MSNTSPDQSGFDFWEFVCCAKCHMPFSLDNGSATVPFWLTECGHVICNSHLNPDQTCSQCGSPNIQVAPLQREMEAPMSEWFQSIPIALDAVAFAAKVQGSGFNFQQETMASQIRHYRSRHQQLRQFVERLKHNVSDLKKANESLQRENERYRLQMGHNRDDRQFPSNVLNSNGKRQIMSTQHFEESTRPGTGSSAQSVNAPLAPNRLTLLPGQELPELSTHKYRDQGVGAQFSFHSPDSQGYLILDKKQQRPESSHSLEQYAYMPPEPNTFHAPPLTHTQAAPRSFQRTNHPQREMPKPENQSIRPSSSRFKPALTSVPYPTNGVPVRRQTNMGPPPTPQHHHNRRPTIPTGISGQTPKIKTGPPKEHVLPPPSRQQTGVALTYNSIQPQSASAGPRRFFPVTGQSSSNPFGNDARGHSRASIGSLPGGQRMPFVPAGGQQGGFG